MHPQINEPAAVLSGLIAAGRAELRTHTTGFVTSKKSYHNATDPMLRALLWARRTKAFNEPDTHAEDRAMLETMIAPVERIMNCDSLEIHGDLLVMMREGKSLNRKVVALVQHVAASFR